MSTSDFNAQVADLLRQMADLLVKQDDNPFRIGAYRRAAETVLSLDRDLRDILAREGIEGLDALPFIGKGIASSIQEIAQTGRLSRLERLRGELAPEQLFQSLPGVGPELAAAIHDELHVDTLEALEVAAHDGRLESVKGVGPRRAAAIRASLASQLGRRPRARRPNGPGVSLLLSLDRDYRAKVRAGDLPKIAPRRFNPEGRAWLPVMHARRRGWHFTVLYSNTARAHQLGKTRDWVVIYFEDGDHREGQHTVVTETRGPLQGKRVIRGREPECRVFYRGGGRAAAAPRRRTGRTSSG
jgi:putative hydrolase